METKSWCRKLAGRKSVATVDTVEVVAAVVMVVAAVVMVVVVTVEDTDANLSAILDLNYYYSNNNGYGSEIYLNIMKMFEYEEFTQAI